MKVPSECPLRACSGLRLPVSKCTLLLGLQVLPVEIPLRVEEKEKRLRANAAEGVCSGFAGVAVEVPLRVGEKEKRLCWGSFAGNAAEGVLLRPRLACSHPPRGAEPAATQHLAGRLRVAQ